MTLKEKTELFQKNIFNTVGIERLVWIDDFFSQSNNSNPQQDCIQTIKVLYESGQHEKLNSLNQLPFLKEKPLDFSQPLIVLEDKLKDIINKETVSTFVSKLSQLDENFEKKQDFQPECFENMKNIFLNNLDQENVITLSLSQWGNENKKILESINNESSILFLVDLDFSKEKDGAARAGIDIVKKILSTNVYENSYCVLLSHEINLGSQEEYTRASILKEIGISKNQINFSVVSKKILKEDKVGIEYKVPFLLQRIYLRKINASLTNLLIRHLTKELTNFSNDLSQRSIYELERVLFDSSEYEGVSEFESLMRIILIKQKQIVDCLLHEENSHLVNKLAKLRELRQCGDSELKEFNKDIKQYHQKLKEIVIGSNFCQLRYTELFDENVNVLHSPLTSGDIFYLQDIADSSILKKYILIAPDCDLIVRSDGTRKLHEVVFIPIREENLKPASTRKEGYSYVIFYNEGDKQKKAYIFDFSKAFSVNPNFLDLCVYNSCGEVYFNLSSPPKPPSVPFIKGWKMKYEQLCSLLTKKEETINKLSIFSLTSTDFEIVNTSNTVGINGLLRKKRLNHPYSIYLLQKYYAYKSRNGEKHDFTSLLN